MHSRLAVEPMEPRLLLSNTVVEYSIPAVSGSAAIPASIASGPNGTLWYTESSNNLVGSLSVASPSPQAYSASLTASSYPQAITESPDGKLWFTEEIGNAIGMIDPSSSTPSVTLYGTAQGMTASSRPVGITYADNYLWFTQERSQQIGRLDPSTGQITEFSSPSSISELNSQIVLGSDGNLWFTEFGAIGIFSPKTDSLVAQVSLPGGSSEEPFSIAAGPDGNIWYTEAVMNSSGGYASYGVGVIDAQTASLIKEIPVSTTAILDGITAGPDGNVWFAMTSGAIAAIDPSTDTITQTLSVPTNVVSSPRPVDLAVASDGNLWFTDGSGAIGEVILSTQLVVSAPPPTSIAAGASFGFTVTDEYATGTTDAAFNGPVQVSVGNGVIATSTAVNGVATFTGVSVSQVGVDTLEISSNVATNVPASTTQAITVTPTRTPSPTPTPTPSPTPTPTPSPTPTPTPSPTPTVPPIPPTIIGETPLYTQKTNKHGKPIGPKVLIGYTIDYSTAMNATTAANSANYQLDRVVIQKIKKRKVISYQPIALTSVYNSANNSVALTIRGKISFPKGGQLTVDAAISDAASVLLDGGNEGVSGNNGLFTISNNGKSISRG